MSYNPNKHHRRSIRLKGYDYSQAGEYFVTICCQNKICRFGKIKNGEMILNDAGKMVEKWYQELVNKFPDIELGEFVIMPNHFHCIIINTGVGVPPVGADLRVCPDGNSIGCKNTAADLHICPNGNPIECENTIADLRVCPNSNPVECENATADPHVCPNDDSMRFDGDDTLDEQHMLGEQGEHVGSPLHAVVQWFKTMTTNEYIRGVKTLGWEPFNKKIWQRNYWEHIIRNDWAYQNISDYIKDNPSKWRDDLFYSE